VRLLPVLVFLAADPSPLYGFLAVVCFPSGSLTVWKWQRRDHSEHAAK
jgi:hypothetical protein